MFLQRIRKYFEELHKFSFKNTPHVHDRNCCCRELEFEKACREAPYDESKPEGKVTFVGTPRANENGNAYGSIWAQAENGRRYTTICGHGGSMWLCLECAQASIEGKPIPRPEESIFKPRVSQEIDGQTVIDGRNL
jgi:hypothetical protein